MTLYIDGIISYLVCIDIYLIYNYIKELILNDIRVDDIVYHN